MRKITTILFIALMLLAYVQLPLNVKSVGENKYLLIIAPGFTPYIQGFNLTKTLQQIINNGTVIKITNNAPYNSVYHQLLLVNNTWNLEEYLPLSNNTVMTSKDTIPSYNALNYTVVKKLWGENLTLFINTPVIDPYQYRLSVNPYYNMSKQYIPPILFKIKFGENTTWKLLGTNITLFKTRGGYRLKIYGYVDIVIPNASLTTPPVRFNITRNDLGIEPGRYFLVFRIIRIDNETALLFTPGGRRNTGWSQQLDGNFEDPIIPDLPAEYLRYMDEDDIKWLFNLISSYYTTLLDKILLGRKTIMHIVYYPVIEETLYYLSVNNTNATLLLENAYKGLSAIIEKARGTIGANITVIIYSPYTFRISNNTRSLMLSELTPGVYTADNINETLVNELSPCKIYDLNGKYIIVSYNHSISKYDEGYLIIYKPEITRYTGIVLDALSIPSYISSIIYGYGVVMRELVKLLNEKINEITNLRDQLNDKEAQINQLNKQIEDLNKQIGNLTAEKTNLTLKLKEMEDKLKEAEEIRNQAYQYLTIGVGSIIVFIIILFLMMRSALTKTATTVKRK